MTPQHCDHECVCNWWACNVNCDILNDPCRRKNCEHDTRSRPLSDELKKERNKLVVEMLSAIPNEGMPVWEERGYLKFINSFRSEE